MPLLFQSECIEKFGESLGEDIWEATNKVFDTMPIAAVIDSKVSQYVHTYIHVVSSMYCICFNYFV